MWSCGGWHVVVRAVVLVEPVLGVDVVGADVVVVVIAVDPRVVVDEDELEEPPAHAPSADPAATVASANAAPRAILRIAARSLSCVVSFARLANSAGEPTAKTTSGTR